MARRRLAVLVACLAVPPLCFVPTWSTQRRSSASRLPRRAEPEADLTQEGLDEDRQERWWNEDSASLAEKLQVEETTDALTKLRRKMSLEEQAFDQEIEDVVIAGKRALLKTGSKKLLRMQRAVEMPGMKTHMFKKIRRQIARALTMRRQREIARGITQEQSRRMRRRRRLELKVKYEDAYGGERKGPKSRRWLRRMGRIV
ncbi:Hypothetical protein SCF082_LOCUS19168 [Durusdinium trenchii]|uniref:Uncharacterized protein n=1 Tax=Durusdinium trenchii TaxID=1381693 RepID=A0ABP0KWG3_9DINO